ncbi:hypothetical protein [Rickettsia endosymbiont of Polydrusus tereticollis]|uniref:hypothetical protein n=1 Tax=Rickettsia endosymbiont of Polydrusus tereticollis TaxID=3066251 RepID=UPI0031333830
MKNILMLLLSIVTISACSAPKPTKISFTRNIKPVNFNDNITISNIIIKSSQVQSCWNKQFAYSINEHQAHPPQFFYAIAHADRIIAHIQAPFIEFVFLKVQSQLRSYGTTALIELSIAEDNNQNPQVILECVKN